MFTEVRNSYTFGTKMKILPSFSQPHIVPTLYEFLSLLNTNEYSLKNVGNQTVDGSQEWKKKNTMEVNGYRQLFCYQHASSGG